MKPQAHYARLFTTACLAAFAIACTGKSRTNEPPKIRIGAPLTLSGPVKPYGEDNRRGLELAAAEINSRGGINGRQLDMQFVDDAGEGTLAVNQVRGFAADSTVLAIVGGTRTNVAQEIAKLTPASKIAFVSVGSTGVWQGEFPEGVYRSTRTDKSLVRPLLSFARDSLKAKRIAIVSASDDAWSASLTPIYTSESADLGMSLVAAVSENKGELDASAKLQRVVASRPDVVVINLPATLALPIANRLSKLGLANVLFLGTAAFSTPATWKLSDSTVLDRVVLAEQYFPASPRAATVAFAKAYRAKYGEDAPPYAAYAYDGLQLLAAACGRLPSCTRETLMAEIGRTTDFNGVLGQLTYRGPGDAVKPIYVLRIRSGSYRLAMEVVGAGAP